MPPSIELPPNLGLTKWQRGFVGMLAAKPGRILFHDELPEGFRNMNSTWAQVRYTRKKMAKFGIEIKLEFGVGYYIPKECIPALEALLA